MGVVVQKFGGSSVATPELLTEAARKAIRAKHAGNHVIVIVSAQGSTTDDLIAKAAQVTGPDGSEWQVEGVDPAAARPVLRSTTQLVLPEDGQVVLPEWLADTWSVHAGDPVQLGTDDGSLTATVVVVGSNDTDDPLLTATDLHRLTPRTTIGELWLRLADRSDYDQAATVDTLTDLVGTAAPTAMVAGLVS